MAKRLLALFFILAFSVFSAESFAVASSLSDSSASSRSPESKSAYTYSSKFPPSCFPVIRDDQLTQRDTLTVTINFRRGYSNLDLDFMGNKEALDKFVKAYNSLSKNANPYLYINGWASPEGTVAINKRLSQERAAVIADYLERNCNISADSVVSHSIGVDWQDLYTYVLADQNVPARDKVLDIIKNVPDIVTNSRGEQFSQRNRLLQRLENGRTWSYMLKHIYPHLRGAKAVMVFLINVPETEREAWPEPEPLPELELECVMPDTLAELSPLDIELPLQLDSLYCSIHTNGLYDIMAVPNIGAELYLGKNFSIAANWWYAWWKSDTKHRYWRTYGGYIAPRYWFGKIAAEKPLTGHHVGLYAQAFLYDFEWGGKGYLSGTPYKNICHRPTWGAGIEYGFSQPILHRLNIDFTVGVGFLKGRYWKYEPLDDGYRWLSLRNLNWYGPTKLEVSLVWLLGGINYNNIKKKGGEK